MCVALGRWFNIDPGLQLANPYVYCANNPVMMIDPDGCLYGDFMDEKGRLIGHDGIDDGKLYVIKTTEKSFGNREDGSFVPAAGLSSREQKATRDFIIENSGNTEAFKNNDIAYRNSVEIESSIENRRFMYDIISQDDGRGGTAPKNNREYGGVKKDMKWTEETPGPVNDPSLGKNATIDLPSGLPSYHSHPSGTKNTTTSTNEPKMFFYHQYPSPQDIRMARTTIDYVFGMGTRNVYMYNSSGVQAIMPIKSFINPIIKK